jgi:hypothetical protein
MEPADQEAPARPADEWRAALGGQIETEGHGILDLGWRRGPTSIQLLTDTLDVRTGRTWRRGRAEVGGRVAAFAAGLWITPWSHGAPDPLRAQLAGYVGPDGRIERWGPKGTWAAAEGFARYCWFVPLPDAILEVPDTLWTHGALVVGYWDDRGRSIRLSGGVDATLPGGADTRVAPALTLEARIHPVGAVTPFGELRAGWAENQDDVIATRLGGMTPYHVPLAGAAWAEFWVEDYVATRLGLEARLGDVVPFVLIDAAVFDFPLDTTLPSPPARQSAAGVGLGARLAIDRVSIEATLGAAPDLPRQDEVSPLSLFVLAGTDWEILGGR